MVAYSNGYNLTYLLALTFPHVHGHGACVSQSQGAFDWELHVEVVVEEDAVLVRMLVHQVV